MVPEMPCFVKPDSSRIDVWARNAPLCRHVGPPADSTQARIRADQGRRPGPPGSGRYPGPYVSLELCRSYKLGRSRFFQGGTCAACSRSFRREGAEGYSPPVACELSECLRPPASSLLRVHTARLPGWQGNAGGAAILPEGCVLEGRDINNSIVMSYERSSVDGPPWHSICTLGQRWNDYGGTAITTC